jgi:hypothetical protein
MARHRDFFLTVRVPSSYKLSEFRKYYQSGGYIANLEQAEREPDDTAAPPSLHSPDFFPS